MLLTIKSCRNVSVFIQGGLFSDFNLSSFFFFQILSLCNIVVPNVRFLLSNLESSWDIAGEVKIEYKVNVPHEQSKEERLGPERSVKMNTADLQVLRVIATCMREESTKFDDHIRWKGATWAILRLKLSDWENDKNKIKVDTEEED